ncbi:uncharacterized protein LOC135842912 [Planococcus citri]|uniref:uncharacterized protein LOC135842912 n=1 Tax=Planococcus citri TaxID=170843 RepID=UPI0031F7E97D
MKIPYIWYSTLTVFVIIGKAISKPRAFVDTSINGYITERVCWSNEACKEEFQAIFACRCPEWSYCRSPGKYYNAYCSIMETGYIWMQNPRNNFTVF